MNISQERLTPKLKIMFFIPRMGGGGAERVVANLSNEFSKRGHDVIIYTPTDSVSFYQLDPSVKISGEGYKISKKPLLRPLQLVINGIRLWFAYSRRVNIENPDAIISFLTEMNCVALTHKKKRYKLVVSERNDPTKYRKTVQGVIKKLYTRADDIVCQSDIVARFFNDDKVAIIPNPIDCSVLPEIYREKRRKVVCAVGRLSPQKNFANLIQAFSMLDEKFSEYILEIYGDGPLREDLQDLVKKLNLQSKVSFMGSHKDVLYKINDTALFVMSSDYEGYPNALVEAMAIGLPVICTDFYSGTARELIQNMKNGLLVPVNDSQALAEAIGKILSDSCLAKTMSDNNFCIREKLIVSKIADIWIDLIKRQVL